MSAAAAAAGGQLAGALIKAREDKKKRKQDAKLRQADAIRGVGKDQSAAIGGIIANLRKTLVG